MCRMQTQEQAAFGLCQRSQSVTSLASPFAAAIDLARTGHLPNVPSLGTMNGLSLPPKPRGMDRRAATELLPSIHSGGSRIAAGHL